MASRIATKSDAIAFSFKYFGVPSALLTGVLAWDFTGGFFWPAFFALLAFFSALPWGLFMWHAVWRNHAVASSSNDRAV